MWLIYGGIEVGLNVVFVFVREGYCKIDINLCDLFDVVIYFGLWCFVVRYLRMIVLELW